MKARKPMTGAATKASAARCSLRCRRERRETGVVMGVDLCSGRGGLGWAPRCAAPTGSAEFRLRVRLVEELLHARLHLVEVLLRGLLAVEDGLDVLEQLVVPL